MEASVDVRSVPTLRWRLMALTGAVTKRGSLMWTKILGIGLAALVLSAGTVRADEIPDSTIPPIPPRYERPRVVNSLIVERAQYRARQRMLRQESRAWHGISSSRPSVQTGAHAIDVNASQSATFGWQPRW